MLMVLHPDGPHFWPGPCPFHFQPRLCLEKFQPLLNFVPPNDLHKTRPLQYTRHQLRYSTWMTPSAAPRSGRASIRKSPSSEKRRDSTAVPDRPLPAKTTRSATGARCPEIVTWRRLLPNRPSTPLPLQVRQGQGQGQEQDSDSGCGSQIAKDRASGSWTTMLTRS